MSESESRHLNNVIAEAAQLRADLARVTGELALRESELRGVRLSLWLNHGHDGLYGDDGEMQCARCIKTPDYKRDPIEQVADAAFTTLHTKLAAADALIEKLDAQLSPMVDAREDWIAKEARLLECLVAAETERDRFRELALSELRDKLDSQSRLLDKLAEAEARIAVMSEVLSMIAGDHADSMGQCLWCVTFDGHNPTCEVNNALGRGQG